jgi:hypothetical protein
VRQHLAASTTAISQLAPARETSSFTIDSFGTMIVLAPLALAVDVNVVCSAMLPSCRSTMSSPESPRTPGDPVAL